jgi:hypothetical protein
MNCSSVILIPDFRPHCVVNNEQTDLGDVYLASKLTPY